MATPKKSQITFVFDIETTGLRAGMGTRAQKARVGGIARGAISPPRITQFAMSRIKHIGDQVINRDLLIGSGPDRGYTSVLQDMVRKHNVVSPQNLPQGFLDDLASTGLYDPSVRIEGSLLNDQVKKHTKHLLQSGGEIKTAEQHIRSFMSHVDDALTKSDSVKLLAYNKGFDIETISRELGFTNPELQGSFNDWYKNLTKSGGIVFEAGERPVHQAMFEKMVSDTSYIPEFTKGKAFDTAMARNATEVGTETLQKHHALRGYVDDIVKIARKEATPETIYRGLSSDLKEVFNKVKGKSGDKLFDEFERIGQILESKPHIKDELRQYYVRVLKQSHGKEVAAHVIDFNTFNFVSGWKQDLISETLEKATGSAHDAVDDIGMTFEINRKYNLAQNATQARETLAKTMASESYRKNAQTKKFLSWQIDQKAKGMGRVSDKLIAESTGGASQISRKLGKLGGTIKSRFKGKAGLAVGAAAVAASLVIGSRVARSAKTQSLKSQFTEQFEDKLEGLRNPYSSWLQKSGINPSKYPYGNVSDFGSGRHALMEHPDVNMAKMIVGQASIQRRMAYSSRPRSLVPNTFRKSDITQSGLVDLSNFIIDMTDADTAKLRRAWVDRDIPIFGSVFAKVQQMGLGLLEDLAGRTAVEAFAPSINVRLGGIDAPETQKSFNIGQPLAGEATDIAERLMQSASYMRVNTPKDSYGRYVGTFYDRQNKDINRQIVMWGGAMSTGQEYMSAQSSGQASGLGIWESPFYSSVASAQAAGVPIQFSKASSFKDLALGNEGSSLYNSAAWMMWRNNQMSGISDQRARNQHVFPTTRTDASMPYNMGSLYS